MQNLNLIIPEGKTTAIVGESGSGKTTLIKLLLKFYAPEKGTILVGNTPLETINSSHWRKKVGTLMQDGFVFSDTIAQNIALADEEIDTEKLFFAAKTANPDTRRDQCARSLPGLCRRAAQVAAGRRAG